MPKAVVEVDDLIASLLLQNIHDLEKYRARRAVVIFWSSLASKTLYAIAGKGSKSTINFLFRVSLKNKTLGRALDPRSNGAW